MESIDKNINFTEKKKATIDETFMANVTNRAFSTYFGDMRVALDEYVHPDDKNRLVEFIMSYTGHGILKEVFRFRCITGEYRYNMVTLLSKESRRQNENYSVYLEMVDVAGVVESIENLQNKVQQMQILLGITDDYTFLYEEKTGLLTINRYSHNAMTTLYSMHIDKWVNQMIQTHKVVEEDASKLDAFAYYCKHQLAEFSVKLKGSILTEGKIDEMLDFAGCLFNDGVGHKCVIGRIYALNDDEGVKSEEPLMDELRFDYLTKVYNKKAITDYAMTLIEEKRPRTVLVVTDLDHFKSVNDTYGHLYGDQVLSKFGGILKKVVGNDGQVGRIGGDEFLIVLTNVPDELQLRSILRAIRTQVKWEFANDQRGLSITCSLGAAVYPTDAQNYEALFKKADFCLYFAKQKGRDRYVFYRDDMHRRWFDEYTSGDLKESATNTREIQVLKKLDPILKITEKEGLSFGIEKAAEFLLSWMRVSRMTVFLGDSLSIAYHYGDRYVKLTDASYIRTEEFKKLLGEEDYFQSGYIGNIRDVAPKIYAMLSEEKVNGTLQHVIGDRENPKGLIVMDRIGESIQWAEYEVHCVSILASMIGMMIKDYK